MAKKPLTPKKSPKPKKPKLPKQPKGPKKPAKPTKPRVPARPGRPGKPDPDKPGRRPGEKPQKPTFGRPIPRSGYIPKACTMLVHSPSLLDCWLAHTPKVANAIRWEPGPDKNVPGLPWPSWTPSMKADLRQAWLDAKAWHANGMTGFAGTLVTDPPPNQDVPVEGGPFFRTVLDGPTQAWPLYIAHVAHSLAMEIGGWVPWTIRTYAPDILEELLAGTQMFVRDWNDGSSLDSDYPGGYVLGGYLGHEKVTPSHPTFTYPFLLQQGLVAPSALGTIGRVLDWCRWHLSHYVGSFTPQNAEYHWQYRGAAPVRRIIEGTLLLDPKYASSFPAPRHWTPGCWGTSGFLRSVLRAVNIPVVPRLSGCLHFVPYFAAQKRYLSHGDDPYSSYAQAKYPPYNADQLLLDEATFTSWFPFNPNDPNNAANQAKGCLNVGRRVMDLAVWHFSDALIDDYVSDKQKGLDHASGRVFEAFKSVGYTVAELEAAQFWVRLEATAVQLGK
jgi:hypothetical protein